MATKNQKPKSVSDLLADSTKAADSHRFDAALRAVNAAVKLSKGNDDPNLMSVLDQRIVLHLRMGNEGTAFRGAKSMIRLDPKDGRGYMRCGCIAKLQNNLSLAISFFDQGVKHVPNSDPYQALLLEELEDAHLERSDQLASKVKDPPGVVVTLWPY